MVYVITFLEHHIGKGLVAVNKKETTSEEVASEAKRKWELLNPMTRRAVIEEVEEL